MSGLGMVADGLPQVLGGGLFEPSEFRQRMV